MQFPHALVLLLGHGEPALGPQGAEFVEVAVEGGFIARQEREQPPPLRGPRTPERHPVVNEVAVPKAFEQPGVAKLLEVLRDARLALREHLGQLGHRALAANAQGQQAQPDRVGERLELRNELLGAAFHNI